MPKKHIMGLHNLPPFGSQFHLWHSWSFLRPFPCLELDMGDRGSDNTSPGNGRGRGWPPVYSAYADSSLTWLPLTQQFSTAPQPPWEIAFFYEAGHRSLRTVVLRN